MWQGRLLCDPGRIMTAELLHWWSVWMPALGGFDRALKGHRAGDMTTEGHSAGDITTAVRVSSHCDVLMPAATALLQAALYS